MKDAILASPPDEQRWKVRELVDVFEKVCRLASLDPNLECDGTYPGEVGSGLQHLKGAERC